MPFFVRKKPCHCPGIPASNVKRYLWRKKDGPFGKELPVSEAPTPYADAEGSDELDSEEVEVVLNSDGNCSSTSPSQQAAKILQSQLLPSTPRNFQPVLSTIPPHSPSPSTSGAAFVAIMRPSPIPTPRNSPMITSQNPNLWPVLVEEEKSDCLCCFLPPKCFS
ncbi:hypothetical protein O181_024029 [Austropuccinia psidii MF-1]|uniref:Uncharacterized protein n=1 Tax=Austropuccinia psidii MF-1 TaxID=1389203 RepID=A0A9Q3GZ94_9BASI|nr:hypothetical protein [Austropuccinia psidii MF-1]